MVHIDKKLERLIAVSQLYYEQNLTQNDIAKQMGISRPMVSKLLAEAREVGVVSITITSATSVQQMLEQRLCARFRLAGAAVAPSQRDQGLTNQAVCIQGFELAASLLQSDAALGVGWGSMVGWLANYLETEHIRIKTEGGMAFPLVGGINASYRSYHTNELVRVLSKRLGLAAAYLYMPAIFDSEDEKRLFEQSEQFREIDRLWETMTDAIVNISNHPSTPDIATAARFGTLLAENHAIGQMVSHYFDQEGRFIQPLHENVMHANLEQLRRAKHVTALCGASVRPECVVGALRSGIVTHVALPAELANAVLAIADEVPPIKWESAN